MMSVDLPALEALSIVIMPNQLTHDLLAAIRIPRCTSFEITYRQKGENIGLLNDPALAHITSLLARSIRSSPLVTITWSYKAGAIYLSTSTKSVTLLFMKTEGGWDDSIPPGLSDVLAEGESPEIYLEFSRRSVPSTILPLFGVSQHCITNICLLGMENYGPMGLIEFLAEPPIVDGIEQWPLPRLRHLYIADSELSGESFVEAISNSSRYRSVRQEGANNVRISCVPLHFTIEDELDASGQSFSPEDIEELLEVVGDENLSYVLASHVLLVYDNKWEWAGDLSDAGDY
ncbi:hypothetical protein FRB94_002267 [Tulasnella sp. JGI-2019a]|nr:hypothetical protein FRB94_002267 [Tulasnella sp. JGI-2019a]